MSNGPAIPPRILFVCLGNICRSPTAEGIMRALAPDWEIDSAGTGSWHVGNPPHPDAVAEAARRGYDLSAQRARRIERTDFGRFDRIVVMDAGNLAQVERLRPKGDATPAARLLDYAPETGVRDVPDPYMEGGFDRTLDLIEAGCRGLLTDLAR
jgi:protein-tyrosine phosphatase